MSVDESRTTAESRTALPEMEPVLQDMGEAAAFQPQPGDRRYLTVIRWVAVTAWVVFMVVRLLREGFTIDRTSLIILLALGLFAASIGRRRMITVIIDWLPFAVILILYDMVRAYAESVIDMPTHWHLAVDVDRWMFGVNPTLWLQEHLKEAQVPWWEAIVSCIYMSYFVVPYVLAAILWLRDRHTWRRFAVCFLATTLLGLVGYALIPAAPPWAAARCTAADVADYPRDPPCMSEDISSTTLAPGSGWMPFDHRVPPTNPDILSDNLLGEMHPSHPGAAPYVERISGRGFAYLHIHIAENLIEVGRGTSNPVAAIPSLHAALTMLVALFMWPRVRWWGKLAWIAYPFAMAFTLVYTAEHYVFDILLGWGVAGFVIAVYTLVDRRWLRPRDRARREQHDATNADEDESPVPVASRT